MTSGSWGPWPLRRRAPLLQLPTLDTILDTHAVALGADFEGYRNHAYRVAHLCLAQLSGSAEEVEKVAIAAASMIWASGRTTPLTT